METLWNVDPDQVVSEEASWSGSSLFTIEFISVFHFIPFWENIYTLFLHSKVKANIFFRTSKIFFGQVHYYYMIIYLYMDKYRILLFPHLFLALLF